MGVLRFTSGEQGQILNKQGLSYKKKKGEKKEAV